MNINQIKPMSGKLLVKKLPDEVKTKSGIFLTHAVNERHDYVEIVNVGKGINNDLLSIGNKGLVMGKGIYDSFQIDDAVYYILNPVDIYAIIED